MKEVKSLAARAKRYLRSAKLLIKDKDYESAASRVYYAMFYITEALLLTRGLSFSSHKAVLSAFGEHFIKTGIFSRDLSKSLKRAFGKRQISDYEFTFVISEKEAKELLKEAENFIASVIEYLKKEGYT
ncbi:MAG: HEPN domain-containing protein [Deltaproteobacteria bacterium]|nr:HEPN domain-containing protein [Deltaproteobacteria bacterium]